MDSIPSTLCEKHVFAAYVFLLSQKIDILKKVMLVSYLQISGNKNAYNDAAIQELQGGIKTKALRFIPLKHVGAPCMRIEICGDSKLHSYLYR